MFVSARVVSVHVVFVSVHVVFVSVHVVSVSRQQIVTSSCIIPDHLYQISGRNRMIQFN